MKYLYIFLIFFLIIISFIIINKYIKKNEFEYFCKISKTNPQGTINDSKVLLDYKPQSDISTSSCNEYWKKWPLESNSTLVENNPIVINGGQLNLPKEKQFGDNDYKKGLIDFDKLANIVNDNINENIFAISKELLIDPITHKKLKYEYELEFSYIELNNKTYVDRVEKYNPMITNIFNYNDIKSPIENINILNLRFKEKCDILQKKILSKDQLILYGLIKYQIFKYKILNINYLNGIISKPVYVIEIVLFRESDLYLNTFSYVGFINDNKPLVTNVKFIGYNATDNFLLNAPYNPNEIKQAIINSNFDNTSLIEKDPNTIVNLKKKYEESFKLKNQYACFNLNYDPEKDKTAFLPYFTKDVCEATFDFYGKLKDVGIYDTPCKKDDECPFFRINKNYDNDFGKCLDTGYCELPINMTNIGYHYYSYNDINEPLCYNCNSNEFTVNTLLDNCCKEQSDKEKYPFLKSPDYSFNGDLQKRINYFNKKFCTVKGDNYDMSCNKIVIS